MQGQLSVFWIYAGSKARFEQDYRKLAVLVQLPGYDDMKTDIRPAVKSWFEAPASGNWILVLDNADNIRDFYPGIQVTDRPGESGDGLEQFVPRGSKGTVLVTTRDYSVADKLAGTNILSKLKMNPEEAMQLFKDRFSNAAEDETSAMLLLQELEYLPLAIVQAAAYIRLQHGQLSPSKYLQQFKATKRDQRSLLSKPFTDLGRYSGSAGGETIFATLAITFEQIQSQWPLAGSLLGIIACIDRQGIPGDLLHASVPEKLKIDINTVVEALSKLIDFALITDAGTGKGSSFVMHALVHVSIQMFLSASGRKMQVSMKQAGKGLLKVLPNGKYENWSVRQLVDPLCSRARPHADTNRFGEYIYRMCLRGRKEKPSSQRTLPRYIT